MNEEVKKSESKQKETENKREERKEKESMTIANNDEVETVAKNKKNAVSTNKKEAAKKRIDVVATVLKWKRQKAVTEKNGKTNLKEGDRQDQWGNWVLINGHTVRPQSTPFLPPLPPSS